MDSPLLPHLPSFYLDLTPTPNHAPSYLLLFYSSLSLSDFGSEPSFLWSSSWYPYVAKRVGRRVLFVAICFLPQKAQQEEGCGNNNAT